uniref:Immunoglobulin V-set domain-containing protein n=1 Tax=Oryzias latipes TaxID=8090 RepID=A0A3P9L2F0_ORYLA
MCCVVTLLGHELMSAASTHHLIHLMASFSPLFPGLTDGDSISPDQDQLTGTEGKSVTMKCIYTPWPYWYKHDSVLQALQFILLKGAKSSTAENIPDKQYESRTTVTSTELIIRELTLADTFEPMRFSYGLNKGNRRAGAGVGEYKVGGSALGGRDSGVAE